MNKYDEILTDFCDTINRTADLIAMTKIPVRKANLETLSAYSDALTKLNSVILEVMMDMSVKAMQIAFDATEENADTTASVF